MFGSSSGSSVFGQQPAFGGFGASNQSSPFGSTLAQSQPSLGSNLFGSSAPFGASSQPSFGATTQSFGSSSTPSFGATSNPAFGSTATSAFGTSTFGSGGAFGTSTTPAFGSSATPAFGASNVPSFGATSSPSFGSSSTPAFGVASTPAFGTSSTPAFGTGSTPAFGASSTPSFNFGSAPAFGQTSSPFGSTASFGAQSSAFGSQSAAPTFSSGFGQSSSGVQQGGSRIAPYTATPEADSGPQTPGKLESISAMPVYKEKSCEELRWEDYQRGDKGGPNPAGQPTPGIGFGGSSAQSSPFASSSSFGQSSSNPFSTPASSTPFSTPASSNPFSTPTLSNQFSAPASSNPFSTPASSNPFASKPSPFGSTGFGTSTSAFGSSGFGTSTTANPFGASSTSAPSLFTAPSTSAFSSNTSSSLFGTSNSSPAFGSSPSMFGSAPAQGTNPSGLNFSNTSAQPFQSTTPFGQTGGAFGQSGLSFGQASAGQSSLFNAPSFGGGLFSSCSAQLSTSNVMGFGQTNPSLSTSFSSTQSAQTNSAFGFGNFNQTQPSIGAFGGGSNMFGQNPGQVSATQTSAVVQSVQNPFGALPPVPQMSTGHAGTSPSFQYGISSMPVVDKPVTIRVSSVLTSRHLSQRRIKLPARKYHPKSDGPKVPFFCEDENISTTPKADAVFIPRENPRALIIQPKDRLPAKANSDKSSTLNGINHTRHENDKMPQEESNHMPNGSKAAHKESIYSQTTTDDESSKEQNHPNKTSQYLNGTHTDHQTHKGDSYISLTGHRAGEAAIVYEHGADIEALMPKLRHSDYYTEPRIQELAAKERAEPGFCRRVNDFVVGRQGYGSIKFLGETDVRRLDLESLVQFNNREVIVYLDDTKKPPVGQGLNKPAEVTLLNIKCYEKKTGQQYTEGPKIEKYKEMLRRKAENQGAEFLSYDPVKGEWKFRVLHFSSYKLEDEDEQDQESAREC